MESPQQKLINLNLFLYLISPYYYIYKWKKNNKIKKVFVFIHLVSQYHFYFSTEIKYQTGCG